MKENWERVKPLYSLPNHELEEMIHHFSPGMQLESVQLLSGGFSNTNYKVKIKSSEKPLVLRISDEKKCRFESALHAKLHESLPVPEIYYSHFQGDASFSIMEWKEGIHLKDTMYSNDTLFLKKASYSTGYWLAQMRKNTFTQAGLFNENLEVTVPMKVTPDTFLSFMEEFLIDGHTGHWLGKELTEKLCNFTRMNSHLLKDIDPTPALVHSDYNGLNIVVAEKEVTGIIDWEFAFAGPVHVDIGNMLRYESFTSFADFEKAFIDGLQSGGVMLQKNWKKLAKLVDLIALCDLLNNKHGGVNKVSDIKRLIMQTIDNWDDY